MSVNDSEEIRNVLLRGSQSNIERAQDYCWVLQQPLKIKNSQIKEVGCIWSFGNHTDTFNAIFSSASVATFLWHHRYIHGQGQMADFTNFIQNTDAPIWNKLLGQVFLTPCKLWSAVPGSLYTHMFIYTHVYIHTFWGYSSDTSWFGHHNSVRFSSNVTRSPSWQLLPLLPQLQWSAQEQNCVKKITSYVTYRSTKYPPILLEQPKISWVWWVRKNQEFGLQAVPPIPWYFFQEHRPGMN